MINKFDLVQDDEILEEYKKVLFADILDFLKKKNNPAIDSLSGAGKLKIKESLISDNTVVMSAVTHFGVDQFLDKVIGLFH